MATDLTRLTFRADSPDAYAAAIVALVRLARRTKHDFTFGPLRLVDCARDGLIITGPDLTAAVNVLAAVTGLTQVDR